MSDQSDAPRTQEHEAFPATEAHADAAPERISMLERVRGFLRGVFSIEADRRGARIGLVALAFCVIMYLVARRIVDSPPGRVMIAIRENEPRAQMIGFNTFLYKLLAVTVSGVMAALAGLMHVLWNMNATPEVLSVETTISALLMTIIGGVGTLVGPMIGAGVLQLLGYWLNQLFGPSWQLIIGVVYILLVLFLPFGIVGPWYLRRNDIRAGWRRLLQPLRAEPEQPVARKS